MPLSLNVHSALLAGVGARNVSIRVDVPPSSQSSDRDPEDAIVRKALSRIGVPHVPFSVQVDPAAPRSLTSVNLAIALAILAAHDKVSAHSLASVLVLGSLTMDAGIQPIRGVLPILMGSRASSDQPLAVLLPRANLPEARLLGGLILLPADSLSEAVVQLRLAARPLPTPNRGAHVAASTSVASLDCLALPTYVRQAIEIAASGDHHILLIGPRGSGTSWLARRLHSLLPPPTYHEALSITAHHSAAGIPLPHNALITQRPFRAPHHTVSTTAVTGTKDGARPGELTLAHHGVLLLDDLTEFSASTLDWTAFHVAHEAITFALPSGDSLRMPSCPLVVATMTTCPCGLFGHPDARCRCTPEQITRHGAHIPAQCRDLFDLIVPVSVSRERDDSFRLSNTWNDCTGRIAQARARRVLRPADAPQSARLTGAAVDLLHAAFLAGTLEESTEARIVHTASTIADLAGADLISDAAIEQAIAYRLPAVRPIRHDRVS
jgi:magnesium chelatase family protein